MKTRTMWMIIAVAAALLLAAGGVGALAGRAEPEAIVAYKINYQGWLTDAGSTPLNGSYEMRFQVYDDLAAGAMYWDSGIIDVEVNHGRFSVDLPVDTYLFDGRGLWIRIYVDGDWLTPRQELLPVPYALSLRPGAEIEADMPTNWVFRATNTSPSATGSAIWGAATTGSAVYGNSTGGSGVFGYSQNYYAVYGLDGGTDQAHGYGGYFYSNTGVGAYGYSAAQRVVGNNYAPGVYGKSANGVGVYGLSESAEPGIRGESTNGEGVYGFSENAAGVLGETDGGTTSDYGVYGLADGYGYGVYGYQSSTAGGLGVYGTNEGTGAGVSGVNKGSATGTWGFSAGYNGVGGATNREDSNYGLYTTDNLYSSNIHTAGAMMQVVQNGGDEPLEMGDVVAIAGMATPLAEGMPPVIQVSKTTTADSVAVVGVVASTYSAEWLTNQAEADPTGATGPDEAIPEAGPGPIAPGDYLLVVVQGPCQVKTEAIAGAIESGDLMASGGQAGFAAKASKVTIDGVTVAAPGTVLGKALEPLEEGQKLLYIYVTLQ
jgi:hypothetical protein